MKKLENRISELEATAPGMPYPLNYLHGKASDDDLEFVRDSGLSLADAMYIDNDDPDAIRYRNICERAGLLPPLKFEQ